MSMASGIEVAHCPDDLLILRLLEAYPAYTRQTLLREPAAFVARMVRWHNLRAQKG